MPIELIYLAVLLITICIVFVPLKRPIYEAMLAGFVVMIAVTGQWHNTWSFVMKTSTNTLFYAIVAFLVLAQLLDQTKVIDACISIILSVFGRLRGGAGYVALIASAFMGALSGSGAGNVAATGVFTIPAMMKSGYPDFLAANISMASSTLGNVIPPSGVIVLSFGVLEQLYPGLFTMSQFWLLMWGISFWFILQRAITIFVFCRKYNIQAIPDAELPRLGESMRSGWKAVLLPVVILLPFVLDSMLKDNLFKSRLGSGASSLSGCVLLFTPGIAALYALFIADKRLQLTPQKLARSLSKAVKGIVPVCATIFFAYCISNLFDSLNVGVAIGEMVSSWGLSLFVLALIIPLFTAFLGMILPGSSQIAIFGGAFVSILAASGANPFLVAGMLPVITGAMEGMTPPLALCMFTAMGIAGSSMQDTTKNCMVWVILHYILSIIMLLGLLPVFGLI